MTRHRPGAPGLTPLPDFSGVTQDPSADRRIPARHASTALSPRARPLSSAALIAWCAVSAAPLTAQLTPPSTGGVVALDHLLQRLSENRRVLIIGAHPDDEDTGLLALMARGYGAEAAYLSLSRGEGGQNLIGNELGVALGLLRSRELVAAREVDGARQFFTRAYDFGYSRSLKETSRFWDPDSLLKDVVRIVRRFKPHVLVSVFSGTSRDGHGQHHAAGVAAKAAFVAAGDPSRFPALASEEGLQPWTPLRLYRSTRFDRASTTVELATGALDPRLGRTYHQIAMASRSRHRSQDMGRLQTIGPAFTRSQLLEDRTGHQGGDESEGDLFFGIPSDTSWIARLADSVRDGLSASRLSDAAAPLAQALVRTSTSALQAHRVRILQEAVGVSASLAIDARASSGTIVPGERVEIDVEFYNAGSFEVRLDDVTILTPVGWLVESPGQTGVLVQPGTRVERRFVVDVPSDARPTQPYFLERPLIGALYDWSGAPVDVRGLPFGPPVLRAQMRVTVLGADVTLSREVTYRYNDQAVGEVRRPVRVVPAVEVELAPSRLVWSSGDGRDRIFTVTLTHNGSEAVAGTIGLQADGWPAPAAQRFTLGERGESQIFLFRVTSPSGVERATVQLRAVARTDDGRRFDRGVELTQYSHIRSSPRVKGAVSTVRVVPIRLPELERVGYIRGAADRVPEALEQIGLPLEMLDAAALAGADLSQFDVIVVGSRAYETDAALVKHNDRLLDYVRSGGRLLVQYQQYQFARDQYAPYPLTISRPHDRITDETASVTILQPNHPAFVMPNSIDSEDWEGWPQERGLYFAGTWDDAYTPLLEMADPGMQPVRGGLLVARYGEGTYVYTGISFFRALPAGVPGPYRLFLNLLNLAAGPVR